MRRAWPILLLLTAAAALWGWGRGAPPSGVAGLRDAEPVAEGSARDLGPLPPLPPQPAEAAASGATAAAGTDVARSGAPEGAASPDAAGADGTAAPAGTAPADSSPEPAPPRVVVGQVVDGTGTPVGGAEVAWEGRSYNAAVTGADGAFRLARVPGETTLVAKDALHLGSAEATVAPESDEPVRLVLDGGPAGRLQVMLVTPEGERQPAAVPAVMLLLPHDGSRDPELLGRSPAGGLRPGRYTVRVCFARGQWAPADAEAEVVAGELRVVEIPVCAGGEIRGRVVDSAGAPVDSVDITWRTTWTDVVERPRDPDRSTGAFGGGLMMASGGRRHDRSRGYRYSQAGAGISVTNYPNPDGEFRLSGLPDRMIHVQVLLDGQVLFERDVAPGTTGLEIIVPAALPILTLRFPSTSWLVELRGRTTRYEYERSDTAVFRGLPPGRYWLWATGGEPRGVVLRAIDVTDRPQEIRLEVSPAGRVHLEALAAESEDPVADVQVGLCIDGRRFLLRPPRSTGEDALPGTFELPAGGPWALEVRAPARACWTRQVSVEAGATLDLGTIRLLPE